MRNEIFKHLNEAGALPDNSKLKTLDETIRDLVLAHLAHAQGNIMLAVRTLKVSRATVYRFIKTFNFENELEKMRDKQHTTRDS